MRKLKQFLLQIPIIDALRLNVLSSLSAKGICFFADSYEVSRCTSKAAEEHIASGKQAIFAIYHGRLTGLLEIVHRDWNKICGLISHHRDGELLAKIGTKMGYTMARGSQTYKAVEGAKQMIKAAENGKSLCHAVDGPRGPIFIPKVGVIRLAEITGLPIIPFVCQPRTAHFMRKSWDKIMGGYWGSPFLYIVGDPIYVPAGISSEEREAYRLHLEQSMEKMRLLCAEYWDPAQGVFPA